MRAYLAKRLLFAVPVIFGVTLLVFTIMRFIPGDPVIMLAGDRATEETIARIKALYGLDKPAPVQFAYFLRNILHGNLGTSIVYQRPVADIIAEALPITLELSLAGILLSLLIGVPAGVISATQPGTVIDQLVLVGALVGVSIPSFWLGILMIYVFGVYLHVLPTSGYGSFAHLVMPAIALGTAGAALISRVSRSSMLDVARQDYIRTARAKGLSERTVIYKHALRNAMLPIVTIVGLRLGYMIAGSIALEMVFARPGMGRLIISGILRRDYPVVQGTMLLLSACVLIANLLADLCYGLLNPRIRYG